jgi:hypothetical protein
MLLSYDLQTDRASYLPKLNRTENGVNPGRPLDLTIDTDPDRALVGDESKDTNGDPSEEEGRVDPRFRTSWLSNSSHKVIPIQTFFGIERDLQPEGDCISAGH